MTKCKKVEMKEGAELWNIAARFHNETDAVLICALGGMPCEEYVARLAEHLKGCPACHARETLPRFQRG